MDNTNKHRDERKDNNPANRDPITGAPGSHPVGTGLGAAGGGAAGAAIGSLGGPVGTVAGAAIGAVAGGLAGKAGGEAVNPTVEDAYWSENYKSRPYAKDGGYETYRPAYRYGWESATQHRGRRFDEVEPNLERGWENVKDRSELTWDRAKLAVRDAWDRITPGDDRPRRP
jgi:hypothetical protein